MSDHPNNFTSTYASARDVANLDRRVNGAELNALKAHTRIDDLERSLARWKTLSGAALVAGPVVAILVSLLHGGAA